MLWTRKKKAEKHAARPDPRGDGQRCFILGADYYVPEKEVRSEEIERRAGFQVLGLPQGFLEEGTGVKSRRYCSADEHPSTLATVAAQKLLERLGLVREGVDALLFAANTMDETEPITAMRVHEALGLRGDAFVADIRDACNSALKAMIIGTGLIRSGMVSNVLVAVGERLHDGINLNIRSKSELVSRYLAGLTLGDAGAAVLLSASGSMRCFEIVHQTWEVDSSKRALARIEAGGTRCLTDAEKIYFVSNSKKLCQIALDKLPKLIGKVGKQLGWDLSSIGFIPHQVSNGVIKAIARMCGIPIDNVMITLDRFGNTGAATIPMALALALENGFALTFRRLILVGGAAGFSGAVLALERFSQMENLSQQLEQFSARFQRSSIAADLTN